MSLVVLVQVAITGGWVHPFRKNLEYLNLDLCHISQDMADIPWELCLQFELNMFSGKSFAMVRLYCRLQLLRNDEMV